MIPFEEIRYKSCF